MERIVNQAAGALGVHVDLIRIAFCILGSFPFGSVIKRIPPKHQLARDLSISFLGLFYLIGVFNLTSETIFLVCMSLFTYFFCIYCPHSYTPWVNFAVQITALLYTHCKEQLTGEDFVNTIGISGTQMIVVQKLISFGWDVHDGRQKESDLTGRQLETRILKPNFIKFFSWIFYFPTVLTGPGCIYNDYLSWSNNPSKIPKAGVKLYFKLLEGIFWVLIYTQTTNISLSTDYYQTSWYIGLPFLSKLLFTMIKGFTFRTKYYAAWTLSEAACMHTGISYVETKDASGQTVQSWNRMCNVNPLRVELGQNIREILANWNISTASWLRYYVFVRLVPRNAKPGTRATMGTFVVSAIWHGTRPGYYLTFVTAGLVQMYGKVYRRNLRPLFVNTPYKRVYDLVCIIVTKATLDYTALPFMVLESAPALAIWRSMYFWPFIGFAVSYILFQSPLSKPVKKVLKQYAHEEKKSQ